MREALRLLEGEGFVRVTRTTGTFVAELTAQDAADLLEIRGVLEPLAAAQRCRAAQRRRTSMACARSSREGNAALANEDLELLAELNTRFHTLLTEASGNVTPEPDHRHAAAQDHLGLLGRAAAPGRRLVGRAPADHQRPGARRRRQRPGAHGGPRPLRPGGVPAAAGPARSAASRVGARVNRVLRSRARARNNGSYTTGVASIRQVIGPNLTCWLPSPAGIDVKQ